LNIVLYYFFKCRLVGGNKLQISSNSSLKALFDLFLLKSPTFLIILYIKQKLWMCWSFFITRSIWSEHLLTSYSRKCADNRDFIWLPNSNFVGDHLIKTKLKEQESAHQELSIDIRISSFVCKIKKVMAQRRSSVRLWHSKLERF